jgi:cytochrome oxidase assembly protein ShyY1
VSSSLIITLEMAGVLGVVLVFGFWQLYSLHRDKRERQRKEAGDSDSSKN